MWCPIHRRNHLLPKHSESEEAASTTCSLQLCSRPHYFSHRVKKLLSYREFCLLWCSLLIWQCFPEITSIWTGVHKRKKREKGVGSAQLILRDLHKQIKKIKGCRRNYGWSGVDWIIRWILLNSSLLYKNGNQEHHAWWTWLRLWDPEGYSCASWQRSVWLRVRKCAAGSSRDGGLCVGMCVCLGGIR